MTQHSARKILLDQMTKTPFFNCCGGIMNGLYRWAHHTQTLAFSFTVKMTGMSMTLKSRFVGGFAMMPLSFWRFWFFTQLF